jgi:uncharacterized protein YhjY with autotransporter beta-barrel domain
MARRGGVLPPALVPAIGSKADVSPVLQTLWGYEWGNDARKRAIPLWSSVVLSSTSLRSSCGTARSQTGPEAAVGARLRYQLSPLVAPYVGVEYERAFGDTADFRRAEGEDAGGWNLLAGIRLWF